MRKVKMILTNRFDPDIRVYKEAKYLIENGFDVEILCWDRENEYTEKKEDLIDGIKVRRFFPLSKYGSGLRQLKAYFKYINEIRKYLKNETYNFLHCHDIDGALAGYLIKRKNSIMIFDMHEFYEGQGTKQKIRLLIRSLVNFLHNKSDAIIYLNEIQKTTMKKSNLKKLIFVPNYPDKENYKNISKTKENKLRISYIGAVRQYMELKNLMDACIGMKNVHIAINGSGVAYSKLKEIKDNYENVEITGRYHFSEISFLYSKTDLVYAVYNRNNDNWKNGYPIKLFESIIAKTPIVVNKGTAMSKFVNDKDIGFEVDGNKIEEIRNLIEYIDKNEHVLAKKVKNLEKIQYDYNWSKVVKNLDDIYFLKERLDDPNTHEQNE